MPSPSAPEHLNNTRCHAYSTRKAKAVAYTLLGSLQSGRSLKSALLYYFNQGSELTSVQTEIGLKFASQVSFFTHSYNNMAQQDGRTRLLLTALPTCPSPPTDFNLPDPIQLTVPTSAALTPTSLALKSSYWPTIYAPRRKGETEPWSQGKVAWARDAMSLTVAVALRAQENGELPIAAHVPIP
ncbi:hypothetical protein ARMGADRAFT_1076281 [Armillaria gallica]|uniref:Uncharacterized protein n=1 Tax=Armillaria gallica TaxID=47427 RepID=A0A2H3DRI1_ARMGA|nr:hypothetical protein ARMGADRAFT_1076281 [Armillaria gallica]